MILRTKIAIALLFIVACACAQEKPFPPIERGMIRLVESESPYLLEQGVVFSSNDSLVIEPGVTVIMTEYAKLMIRGYLKIAGTEEKPVVFRSADSSGTWNGFHFVTANRPFEIRHLVVENAFRNTVFRSKGIFENVKFINNYYGLWVDDIPEVFLARCEFSRNRYALSVRAGRVISSETKIINNVYGLYLEADGKFDGDTSIISNNLESDIRKEYDELLKSGKRVNRNMWQRLETGF